MTTILWDGQSRTLASDTLAVSDDGSFGFTEKSRYIRRGIIAVAGLTCGMNAFQVFLENCHQEPERRHKFPKILEDCECLFLNGITDELLIFEGCPFPSTYKLSQTIGIGSGSSVAVAFNKAGYSARESVEFAATVDIYTGGDVDLKALQRLKDYGQ